MHKFLLVTAAVAVAMILPVMALAENDQFNPEQNTSVVGGSNSSTVKDPEGSTAKEPEGSTVKEPEGAANESKVPETGKPIVSAEDVAVTERLQDLVENKLQQYVPRAQDRTGIDSFLPQAQLCTALGQRRQIASARPAGDRLSAWSGSCWPRSQGLPDPTFRRHRSVSARCG